MIGGTTLSGRLAAPERVRLDSVADAVAAFAEGRFVIVVDDENRENEGDLICSASTVTAADIAFLVRYTSGIVCVPMAPALLDRLAIPLMVRSNSDPFRTAFTVSVDARRGVTTGVSAADRAHTIRLLAHPAARTADFVSPGHLFPLRGREEGVLARPGHTEAALDLARLAGMRQAGVLAEVVNDDGTMMRAPGLREFADRHGLVMISIADLVEHRRRA